jgi:hypothetical protein
MTSNREDMNLPSFAGAAAVRSQSHRFA